MFHDLIVLLALVVISEAGLVIWRGISQRFTQWRRGNG